MLVLCTACVCRSERERERQRESKRERERERDRESKRERWRDGGREVRKNDQEDRHRKTQMDTGSSPLCVASRRKVGRLMSWSRTRNKSVRIHIEQRMVWPLPALSGNIREAAALTPSLRGRQPLQTSARCVQPTPHRCCCNLSCVTFTRSSLATSAPPTLRSNSSNSM